MTAWTLLHNPPLAGLFESRTVMTALVFVACLLAAPDRCEEQSLLFVSPLNPVSCMMQAPREIAAWSESHPAFRVTAWRCEDAARRGSKA